MTDAIYAAEVIDEGLPLTERQRFVYDAMGAGNAESSALLMKVDIRGALDSARLQAALKATIAAHEGLRTAFRIPAGYRAPRQSAIAPDAAQALMWDEVDLRDDDDAETSLEHRLRDERHDPFDLENGRLVRALLFHLSDGQALLALLVTPLVSDRSSLDLLYRHLVTIYHHSGTSGASTLPEVDLPHAQFVEWRHELDNSEDATAGHAYWNGLKLEATEAPKLSYRFAPGARGTLPGRRAVVRQTIDADVVSGLKTCGVSLDTALQAAWWLLISRVTGQSGFVAGWQHDCRRDYEALADTVGALEEAFPVAFRAEDDDVVGAVLTRLDAMLDNHREAQEFWRSETLSGHAMRLIGFGMRNLPPVIEKDGLRWEARQVPGPFERFELALDVGISDGQPVEAAVYHVPQFYSGVAAERLLEQYLTVLSSLPGHMKKPVGDLPVAGRSEQDRCLAMNDTALALQAETILEQFAGQVARQPDAAALSDRGETWSYAQLDARVKRLARQLRRHGVGTESRVALLMPRSANLIVALWAVLRAGGSYVPLDPAWPEGRRLAILADAAPRVVLTTEDLMPVQCPDGMAFLDVAELLEGVGSTGAEMQGDLDAPADIIPEQVAYVLYTSGSTGKPKGVVVEHRHLMNYVAAVSEALGLDECRRFALTSSVAADLGNTALFGAFHNGGCLFVADDDAMADGASFAKFLAEQNIDCLKIVPSHLAALLDTDLSALPRTLVLGGEPTSWSLVDAIHARDPACRIHNHYGPTEATVGVMVHSVVPGALRQGDGPHLERVLGNCRVYLLDPARRLVPVGALGELYIGGAQVCRGYLDQTDSPAFVADPFVPGDRLYRTGDLGRYLPEGGLRIVGRADAQVKIRGFRVEPAEVETVLLSAPGVGQAAVRTFGEGDQIQLVAYVVPCPGMDEQSCSEYLLKEHARNLLTDAMVPARVMILSAFPRLANGKIDRQALSEPDTKDTEKHYVAPRDAVEAVLAGLIAELLERERVSVEESFFDLGGHSLLVIKLVARLRKLLQVEAEPGIVFDHPSVAALAQALRDAETTPGRLEKVAGLRQRIAAMSEEERAAILLKNAFPADGKVA